MLGMLIMMIFNRTTACSAHGPCGSYFFEIDYRAIMHIHTALREWGMIL